MTIETQDEASVGTTVAPAAPPSVVRKPSPWRVDVIGASAVVLAAAGLVGTVLLLRSMSATPAVTVPPMRDDWYLNTPTVLIGQYTTSARPTVVSVPPARDDWYLDTPTTQTAQSDAFAQPTVKPVPPTRDDWWLDVGGTNVPVQQP
jgi:hypothetical protein